MPTITINIKKYELTQDEFGITYVNGLSIDDFMKTLSTEDYNFLVKKGVRTAVEEPEHTKDIIERLEMPKEQSDFMISLGTLRSQEQSR